MVAFSVAVAIGVMISAIVQSERVRQFLTRLGLDKNLAAFATTAIGLAVVAGSVIAGLNLGGLPMRWEAPMPGLGISIAHALRLVVMLVVVFWLVSVFKRVLFNRYLSRMGTDRALQYTVAQISGYVALMLGIFMVLQNAGIDLSALTVFAGAVGVGIGFGLQNVAAQFHQRSRRAHGAADQNRRPHRGGKSRRSGRRDPRAQHHGHHQRQHRDHRPKFAVH